MMTQRIALYHFQRTILDMDIMIIIECLLYFASRCVTEHEILTLHFHLPITHIYG